MSETEPPGLLARLAGVARAQDNLIFGREVSGREAAD
jgi:hypothetical protein